MMQKIQFMINLQKLVKKHNNIIQLIGAINDENDNGKTNITYWVIILQDLMNNWMVISSYSSNTDNKLLSS